MKTNFLSKTLTILLSAFILIIIFNCSSDESTGNVILPQPAPTIIITGTVANFGDVDVLSESVSQSIQLKGENLTANLNISVSANFKISLDDAAFSTELTISKDNANSDNTTIYVRFTPAENAIGFISGAMTVQSTNADAVSSNFRGNGVSITPIINIDQTDLSFGEVTVGQVSVSMNLLVNADNLVSDINLIASNGFKVSLDDVNFVDELPIAAVSANDDTVVYVRFAPTDSGDISGTLELQNVDADTAIVNLSGHGLPVTYNYPTFTNQRIAFGGGFNQTETALFNLHPDNSNIQAIKMYVKLRCPSGGCNAWDVYSNIKIKDTDSGDWYEIGRYITPYGVDNAELDRGFEIDVTDFKSLLEGTVELFARIEVWGADGWELTVDFDYIEGTPDYPYYAVSKVFSYDDWSTSGVIYGSDASAFDLTKSVSIPANTQMAQLRTIISGWGHATPTDSDGRPCAEWCYRTHDVKINGSNAFQHVMGPIGCSSNPVSPQNGNWSPDRAGWCPGMAVPVRTDNLDGTLFGNTFTFEYDYENWTTDGGNTSGQGGAFYATSTFVIVKSLTPIAKPVVTD